MATGVAFEDADDAISWDKMQHVLSPQQGAHGCRRIIFDIVQRLKSRRYSTVLNTFTLLHTYSLNAGEQLRELLVSDHLFNTFSDIQSGRSNTLAAGLAQLLFDWKHMFGDTSLGLKYNAVLQASLPRAAPHIRPSAPAEQFLVDPPDPAETFRRPLQHGFDFSLFNQKHKAAVPMPGHVPAAPAPPVVDYTSDNPTTGDSQPHTEGGWGPRSAHELDAHELDAPARPQDEFNTTAPASIHAGRVPTAMPVLSDGHRAQTLPHLDAAQKTASPLQQQQVADALVSPPPRDAQAHPHTVQPTPSPADDLAAHPLSELPADPPAAAYSQPSQAKPRLGLVSSYAHDMPSDVLGVPTENWDLSITNVSYPDSCPPDQPMPDFKSNTLFGDAQTQSVSIAEDPSTPSPVRNSLLQKSVPATSPTTTDAAAATPAVPGGGSIAELHQRIASGFDRTTPANGGLPVLTSEHKSISTPLTPLQGGRDRDLSEIEDSNCIQSDLLQRVTEPTASTSTATPAATHADLAVAVPAGDVSGSTGQTAATCGGSPDSRVTDSHSHEHPAAAQAPLVSAEDPNRAQSIHRREHGVEAAPAGPAGVVHESPALDGGAKGRGEQQGLAPKTRTSQHPHLFPGEQTIAWEENEGRHYVKEGSIQRRNRVYTANSAAIPADNEALEGARGTSENAATQQPADVPAISTAPADSARQSLDNRYIEAARAVPAVAIGPTPAHTSKPTSSHHPGAPIVVIRPPKQITGASPKAVRNGANSFGNAEPSPPPETPPKSSPGLAQNVNGLIEALAAQSEVVARFTTLVENARQAGAADQELMFIDLGNTQVGVFKTLQQQVQKALGDMREQLAGASDIALKVSERRGHVNSTGKTHLSRWEQVVGPAAAAAAALPPTPTAAGTARHAVGQVRTPDVLPREDSEVPMPLEKTRSEKNVSHVSEAKLGEARAPSLPASNYGASDGRPGQRVLRRALGRVVRHSKPPP